jgi:hypothetical protein
MSRRASTTTSPSSDRVLGFEFAPVPRTAVRALGRGEIDPTHFAIIAFLWDRADRRTRRATATLAQIREAIGWEKSEDALWKRLRRLELDGWFSSETTPGRRAAHYIFTLNPAPEKRSEDVRRSEAAPIRRSDRAQSRSTRGVQASEPTERSEERDRVEAVDVRRRCAPVRGSEEAGSPLAEPDPAAPASEPFGALQRGQRENALTEEVALGASALGPKLDQLVGETTGDDHDRKRGTMAGQATDDGLIASLRGLGDDKHDDVRAAAERARLAFERKNGARRIEVLDDGSLVWHGEAVAGEEGFLADCEALVAAGIAKWRNHT